ncbi:MULTISPECIES: hypothetical protein [unclassified Sporosarcina]|nr:MULTISPECIES: hypothetical protein [unclassified Sporosarcina]
MYWAINRKQIVWLILAILLIEVAAFALLKGTAIVAHGIWTMF